MADLRRLSLAVLALPHRRAELARRVGQLKALEARVLALEALEGRVRGYLHRLGFEAQSFQLNTNFEVTVRAPVPNPELDRADAWLFAEVTRVGSDAVEVERTSVEAERVCGRRTRRDVRLLDAMRWALDESQAPDELEAEEHDGQEAEQAAIAALAALFSEALDWAWDDVGRLGPEACIELRHELGRCFAPLVDFDAGPPGERLLTELLTLGQFDADWKPPARRRRRNASRNFTLH